jgi:pyruvate kinase
MRHTKIVATVGPASDTPDALRRLLDAGVDVFRLNFSHGTHESHARTCGAIRAAAAAAGRTVAIMQDLSGPKIRTGPVDGGTPLVLREGEELRIGIGDMAGSPGHIFTPYAELVRAAHAGDRLLLDDGRIELRVTGTAADVLQAVVVHGGSLGGHKGINAPGVALPSSAVTAKDARDLRFGLELGVDLVALSFVQRAADLHRAREVMAEAPRQAPLIAKIERPAAVDHLDDILEHADGVMVARGDLGLEMPLERVPRIQKQIIRAARRAGRPAIVATQVLESMRVEPRPTRAEVSDAANAVDEGADAIMLAGETAIGAYPVAAVQVLDAVIREAEQMPSAEVISPEFEAVGSRHARALCEAAVTLATTGQADAIVALTRGGKTARILSSLRPRPRVLAVTPAAALAQQLALLWGVTPVLAPERKFRELGPYLREHGYLDAGAVVVLVNISHEMQRADANFLNVQRVG